MPFRDCRRSTVALWAIWVTLLALSIPVSSFLQTTTYRRLLSYSLPLSHPSFQQRTRIRVEFSENDDSDSDETLPDTHQSSSSTDEGKGRYDRAFHQVEHRTKEKFYTALIGRVTERFHELAEKGSIRKWIHAELEKIWVRLLELRRNERGIKAATHSTLAASDRIGERLMEQAAERSTKIASTTSTKKIFRGIFPRARIARASKTVVMGAETGGEHIVLRVAERGSERVSIRFAKGMTIALPVVGGVFAIYLLRQDMERCRQEMNGTTALAFFLGAAVADLVDVCLHFFIASGLILQLRHHALAVAEEWSIGCAAVSTVCAVTGEILSSHRRSKHADADQTNWSEQDKLSPNE